MPFNFVFFTLKCQVIINGSSGKLDFLVDAGAAAGFPGPKGHQKRKDKEDEKEEEYRPSSIE